MSQSGRSSWLEHTRRHSTLYIHSFDNRSSLLFASSLHRSCCWQSSASMDTLAIYTSTKILPTLMYMKRCTYDTTRVEAAYRTYQVTMTAQSRARRMLIKRSGCSTGYWYFWILGPSPCLRQSDQMALDLRHDSAVECRQSGEWVTMLIWTMLHPQGGA